MDVLWSTSGIVGDVVWLFIVMEAPLTTSFDLGGNEPMKESAALTARRDWTATVNGGCCCCASDGDQPLLSITSDAPSSKLQLMMLTLMNGAAELAE